MAYITTYPPSGACAFNAARITLHTLPRCAVLASCTTNTQPLPHNSDRPQASLVFREWVQDSYHPAGEYLPSYLVVGALL
jgi:hypothetical protein